jgi:hypothetical protein
MKTPEQKLASVLSSSIHKVLTEVDDTVICPENERKLYSVQLTQASIDLIISALTKFNLRKEVS